MATTSKSAALVTDRKVTRAGMTDSDRGVPLQQQLGHGPAHDLTAPNYASAGARDWYS